MIHVYKAGGAWKAADGTEYTVKAVQSADEFIKQGWKLTLAEVAAEVEKTGVDGGEYERQLRDKIKALGGKPAGRSSVERLEAQLAELEGE